MFRKFFFKFLLSSVILGWNKHKRREKWKLTAPFYCQNVKTSPPSFPKADAKVALLRTSAKYIQAFFEGLRELFHNSLIDRYVLKHIFLKGKKGRKERDTLYIYARASEYTKLTP